MQSLGNPRSDPSQIATVAVPTASFLFNRSSSLRILGSRVDRLEVQDIPAVVSRLLESGKSHQIVTANALMLLAAESDLGLRHLIERATLVVPESSGIAWASRRVGQPIRQFFPGIDLFLVLCRIAASKGESIYLLGGKPGAAAAAAVELVKRTPGLKVAGTRHGYFSKAEETKVIEEISHSQAGFLFVGLSVPAQEKWIDGHLAQLKVRIAMGVGGSFDVLSGRLRRAPLWMRRWGLEWIFRTVQEPWRLKRIIGLPVFVWHVLRQGGVAGPLQSEGRSN